MRWPHLNPPRTTSRDRRPTSLRTNVCIVRYIHRGALGCCAPEHPPLRHLHARNAPVVNQHFRWTPLWKQPQPPPAWSVHTGAPRCARMDLVHLHGLFVCLHRGGSAAPVGGRRDSLPRHLTDWVSLWSWVHAPCSASGHCPHRRSLTAALKTMPWLKRLLCHRPDARASRYSPPAVPVLTVFPAFCCVQQCS